MESGKTNYIEKRINYIEKALNHFYEVGMMESKECEKESKIFSDNQRLLDQIELINNEMPNMALSNIIYTFLSNSNNYETITTKDNMFQLKYKKCDDIILEYLILNKLMEFGKTSAVYQFSNLNKIEYIIEDKAINNDYESLALFFHQNDSIMFEMIQTFVRYNYMTKTGEEFQIDIMNSVDAIACDMEEKFNERFNIVKIFNGLDLHKGK